MRRLILIAFAAFALGSAGFAVAHHFGNDYWLHCQGVRAVCTEEVPPTTTVTVTEPAPPPPPPPPPGEVVDVTNPPGRIGWVCDRPVNLSLLRVRITPGFGPTTNAVTLDPGCTGVIQRVAITAENGADGIKIRPPAPGATNLEINGGFVIAHDRTPTENHTDGLQAGAGLHVRIRNVAFIGGQPANAGNADYFMQGWGGGQPIDVVCEHCAFGPYDAFEQFSHGLFIDSPSTDSGARDSRVCQGDYFATRIDPGAVRPVNVDNEVVMHSAADYWARCSPSALLAYVGG